MAPPDYDLPETTTMPPPTLKRPRQSVNSATASGSVPAVAASQPRAKRRKRADSAGMEEAGMERDKSGKPVPFGLGMVKGREEEWGEPADIKTKVGASLDLERQSC
jgi:hypothetical protein